MNYKDLQNISNLSQQILSESTTDSDCMNRWPYSSPYLQESAEVVDEERAPGVKAYRPNPTQAEVRANAAKAEKRRREAGKDKSGYGPEEKFKDWKDRSTPGSKLKRKGGEEETVSQRMDREKPYGKRMTGQMAREYGSRHAAEVTRVVKGAGEPQAVTYPRKDRDEKKKPSREIVRRDKQEESFDLYDLILTHLLDEGFAETSEAAIAIMSNMSEDWRHSIVEAVSGGSYYDLPGAVIRAASGAASKFLNRGQPTAKPKPHPSDSKLVDVSTAEKASRNLPGSRVYRERQQREMGR